MLKSRFALPLLGLLLAATIVPAQAGATVHRASERAGAMDTLEAQLAVAINRARRSAGLRAIKVADPCLDDVAEAWSRRLARTGLFEHRDQSTVLSRCDQSWAGENLIRGTGLTASQAVQAWLDSPPHKAVLLKPRASRIGVAVRRDAQGRLVGVLNLGDS